VTSPSWPFSWPSPPGWGTEIGEAAAIIAASPRRALPQWEIKTYRLEASGLYGEVMLVGGEWYATFIVRARGEGPTSIRQLGCFADRMAAMDAVDQAIDEHQAADS
jgi:hypothetical protein